MSESAIHLKLDRILAGQDRILTQQADHDAAIGALTAALSNLNGVLDTQRELLLRLTEAVSSEEGAFEMRDLIASVAHSLKQIEEDGGRMVTMLFQLPPDLSKAAYDGVRLAMGDGIDIPASGP